MEEITAGQFLENFKDWKPNDATKALIAEKLAFSHAPIEMIAALRESLCECSTSSFNYIQRINELAVSKIVDRDQFLPLLGEIGRLVREVRESGGRYAEVFKEYDAFARPNLQEDHFDTVYYDTIQGLRIREILKQIVDEVEVLLQSFSLVSQELSGVRCVDLYEECVRFQLFFRYFLSKESFSKEELWSILFDVQNQVEELGKNAEWPTPEELKNLQERINKFKSN